MSDPTEPRPAASPGEVDLRVTLLFEDAGQMALFVEPVRETGQVLVGVSPAASVPASLLGSGDDDQRGESSAAFWRDSAYAMEQARDHFRTQRDAEKARADAAVEALAGVRELHRPVRHDWRGGYREVCATCAVARSEPYYNERRTWWELADWPCAESLILDRALLPADTTEDGPAQ